MARVSHQPVHSGVLPGPLPKAKNSAKGLDIHPQQKMSGKSIPAFNLLNARVGGRHVCWLGRGSGPRTFVSPASSPPRRWFGPYGVTSRKTPAWCRCMVPVLGAGVLNPVSWCCADNCQLWQTNRGINMKGGNRQVCNLVLSLTELLPVLLVVRQASNFPRWRQAEGWTSLGADGCTLPDIEPHITICTGQVVMRRLTTGTTLCVTGSMLPEDVPMRTFIDSRPYTCWCGSSRRPLTHCCKGMALDYSTGKIAPGVTKVSAASKLPVEYGS
jgi:hypothetical protein